MILPEEGAEVNKFDLVLLIVLDQLYVIIAQYDRRNVFIWTRLAYFSPTA